MVPKRNLTWGSGKVLEKTGPLSYVLKSSRRSLRVDGAACAQARIEKTLPGTGIEEPAVKGEKGEGVSQMEVMLLKETEDTCAACARPGRSDPGLLAGRTDSGDGEQGHNRLHPAPPAPDCRVLPPGRWGPRRGPAWTGVALGPGCWLSLLRKSGRISAGAAPPELLVNHPGVCLEEASRSFCTGGT